MVRDLEEEISDLRSMCEEDKVSVVMNPSGFSCIKILPDSKTRKDRFFTFLVKTSPEPLFWKGSVWVSSEGHKILKIYLEPSSGLSMTEAFEACLKTLKEGGE